MFLPDYVESGFAHASIVHEGVKEPLVRETKIIYESTPEDNPFPIFHPLVVFFIFLLLTLFISYRDVKKNKLSIRFDCVLFGVVGFAGILLLLLWVATSHHASAKNMNLLWALPTHLVAVVAFVRQPRWLEKYFLIVTVLAGLLLLSWSLLPQKLHYSLIPFVAALGVRAYVQYRIRKQGR
jgi:drug/metabolite transporter (DMT)-like permease